MKTILVEISYGELLDKISILEIKKERINDPEKLKFINDDLNLLKIQMHKITKSKNFKNRDKIHKLYLSLKKLDLKSTEPNEYYKFSHELGIPQRDMDKLSDKLFGIECNFEELNGIDFKKGCYVGQENTSRIKLRNKLSKRLLPIQLIKGNLEEGASILNNENEVGKVLINNDQPFGLIKYLSDHFNHEAEFRSENATFKIKKPDWIKK